MALIQPDRKTVLFLQRPEDRFFAKQGSFVLPPVCLTLLVVWGTFSTSSPNLYKRKLGWAMLTNKVHGGTGGNSWLTIECGTWRKWFEAESRSDLQAWTAWTMVKPVKHRAQFRVHRGVNRIRLGLAKVTRFWSMAPDINVSKTCEICHESILVLRSSNFEFTFVGTFDWRWFLKQSSCHSEHLIVWPDYLVEGFEPSDSWLVLEHPLVWNADLPCWVNPPKPGPPGALGR